MAAFNNVLVQNVAMPRNAARHPLVKTGRVSPLMLQPLFKEIDELDYGGKELSSRLSTPRWEHKLIIPPVCISDNPQTSLFQIYQSDFLARDWSKYVT